MKRQKIYAEDAMHDILQFVYNDEETSWRLSRWSKWKWKWTHIIILTFFHNSCFLLELMKRKNIILHRQYLQCKNSKDLYSMIDMSHCSSLHFQFIHFSKNPNENPEVDDNQNIALDDNNSQNGENDNSDNSGEDEEPVGNTARYQKIKLTYQRKVHLIDSPPDESNCRAIIIAEKVKKIKSTIENEQDKKKTIVYIFRNQPPNNINWQRRADVVKGRSDPVSKARNTPEPVDVFHLLFAIKYFELIVKNTNKKIKNLLASVSKEKLKA